MGQNSDGGRLSGELCTAVERSEGAAGHTPDGVGRKTCRS